MAVRRLTISRPAPVPPVYRQRRKPLVGWDAAHQWGGIIGECGRDIIRARRSPPFRRKLLFGECHLLQRGAGGAGRVGLPWPAVPSLPDQGDHDARPSVFRRIHGRLPAEPRLLPIDRRRVSQAGAAQQAGLLAAGLQFQLLRRSTSPAGAPGSWPVGRANRLSHPLRKAGRVRRADPRRPPPRTAPNAGTRSSHLRAVGPARAGLPGSKPGAARRRDRGGRAR